MAERNINKRSLHTRSALISAAEKLFAEHGVAATSATTIGLEAGQRNRNAVQYHFGGKQGLLQAIFDKHSQQVKMLRGHMFESCGGESIDERRLAECIVTPIAARLEDPDGGEAYIHICAELAADSVFSVYHRSGKSQAGLRVPNDPMLTEHLNTQLNALPDAVRQQRIQLLITMVFHSLSDHAKIARTSTDKSEQDFFTANLIDACEALLSATCSKQTLGLL